MSSISCNRSAAIEGFPLYLVIIVIIAVVSIGIVMGMMSSVSTPKTIKEVKVLQPDAVEVSEDGSSGVYKAEDFDIRVKVVDNNGDPISGAIVTVSGNNVKRVGGEAAYGKTDSNGEVVLKDLCCEVVGGTSPLTIKAEKSGYGEKTTTLPVVKV